MIFYDGLFNISYCLIIHSKNWKITIKLHFENLSIFIKKSERTHMLGPPSPCLFLFAFQWPPPSPPQRRNFLNDPNVLLEKSISKLCKLKFDQYFQGHIHYSNRSYTPKITPGLEKVLTLQKPVRIQKKNPEYQSQIDFKKIHQIL